MCTSFAFDTIESVSDEGTWATDWLAGIADSRFIVESLE